MKFSNYPAFGSMACFAITVCSLPSTLGNSPFVLKTVVNSVDPYFHREGIDGTRFEKLGSRFYTLRCNWSRILAIDSDEGLVVIDSMNQQMAAATRPSIFK